ncbi:thiosulfate oxidation carrier protein SoxY [Allopusillimonas ginsengisoli]|uniref:thiosulfate oxidation carrier protein SoxY n=1 Tax=Allopusillimonas ginsengisoli TaxID=453575 RepID=UPI00101EFFC3|nr:thiosulfate oxidation carrier protein SoxY [Allopusillimonas ginsengisoli]TEA77131.1 thiosulfate oxidation carrier protein SoxY [Allopusillimonas ginsengisoli]
MNKQRRNVLKLGTVLSLAVTAGILRPEQAWAVQQEWNEGAFSATSVDDVIKAFGGDQAAESDKIKLVAPDIAENGAVVPVGVTSDLPNTTQISILVPNNPSTLTAHFDIAEGTMPDVATRIKMGGTSDVYALVKADDKFYTVHKEIKVTLGGCGG